MIARQAARKAEAAFALARSLQFRLASRSNLDPSAHSLSCIH
jgi:hypothetical protein